MRTAQRNDDMINACNKMKEAHVAYFRQDSNGDDVLCYKLSNVECGDIGIYGQTILCDDCSQ